MLTTNRRTSNSDEVRSHKRSVSSPVLCTLCVLPRVTHYLAGNAWPLQRSSRICCGRMVGAMIGARRTPYPLAARKEDLAGHVFRLVKMVKQNHRTRWQMTEIAFIRVQRFSRALLLTPTHSNDTPLPAPYGSPSRHERKRRGAGVDGDRYPGEEGHGQGMAHVPSGEAIGARRPVANSRCYLQLATVVHILGGSEHARGLPSRHMLTPFGWEGRASAYGPAISVFGPRRYALPRPVMRTCVAFMTSPWLPPPPESPMPQS